MSPMPHHAAMMASMGHGTSMGNVPRPNAAMAFVTMWSAMMVVMMLPSLWPTLVRYRRSLGAIGVSRPVLRTTLVAAAYAGVWVAIGLMVFAAGAILSPATTPSSSLAHITPLAVAGVIATAGLLQLTRWKAHHLAHCRDLRGRSDRQSMNLLSAWRDGIHLGMHCAMSCLAPMSTLLVVGMMDVRAMAVVTAAITAERVLPAGARIARATGAIALGAGVLALVKAIGVA
jgi:predicted metal-binding membrane protein